jgi:hypothetical protein
MIGSSQIFFWQNLLTEIILKIEATGIEVWAMTSDGGSKNQCLLKSLGITVDQTSFTNPADPSRQVYVFVDVPHVLKLIRNHILDDGIWVDGQTEFISQQDFKNILEKNRTELKIHHKLTDFHLYCSGPQRQRVRLAAQLLSHSSARAIERLNPEKVAQSNFVELIDSW